MKLAIVSSRFSEKAGSALEKLRASCFAKLKDEGVEFEEFRVPGAFEIPTLAKKILLSKKFDGVVCLGVVVRGETAHFDFVAGNCARKIADLGVEFAQPVIFGVLTVENKKQAETRAKRGAEFAAAAVQLASELAKIEA
ncbi:6,7-dimethyl-8-ribityllumazine synthase [Patescibacteria group bacterium]|nr:6,7-dimethyl-8-ribityllumazine synthase [Patescibacteria group bacterium]